ncbi:MAG: hypothetical protein H7X77_07785 [Anaerolineae bacterium]|nr:hypothetical protein [Anaerolineae bacterium]
MNRLTRSIIQLLLAALLLLSINLIHAQEVLPLPGGNQSVAGAPPAPVPYSPFNGGISNHLKPTFRWNQANGATKYVLRLSNLTTGTEQKATITAAACTSACAHTFPDKLVDGNQYAWRVEAVNDSGKTPSAQFTVLIEHPGVPTLMSPINDAKVTSAAVQLIWTSITEASEYVVKMKDTTTGATALKKTVSKSACGGSCVYALKTDEQTAIIDGHDYQWTVTAKNSNGKSKSGKYSFKARFDN